MTWGCLPKSVPRGQSTIWVCYFFVVAGPEKTIPVQLEEGGLVAIQNRGLWFWEP
jgi:hypothetical protein